jgi:hypothetical protein
MKSVILVFQEISARVQESWFQEKETGLLEVGVLSVQVEEEVHLEGENGCKRPSKRPPTTMTRGHASDCESMSMYHSAFTPRLLVQMLVVTGEPS